MDVPPKKNRRARTLTTLGVLFGLLGPMASGACSKDRPPPPLRNLVLIVVDTLRHDHLHAYGYARETAPTFSMLAAEGALFDGVAPSSWTKPSTASILTGLHPLRHQAISYRDALPARAQTLAELLRARGYRTLGVTANGWISKSAGFARGFDDYCSMLDDRKLQFATAAEVNAEMFSRLAALRAPYFLYVHYLDPHAPYDPDRDYRGRRLTGRLAQRKGGVGIIELRMNETLERPAELLQDAIDLYDGEIRRADDAIGELLGELRRRRLAPGTLTVVTSDHGEEMQEHGRMGHGQTLYEEVVRVPLLMHGPGAVPAGVRLGTASLMDVMPTVLDLLSLPVPEELDGVSLAAQLGAAPAAAGPAGRELLLHLDVEEPPAGVAGDSSRVLALRGERFKLVLSERPRRKALFDHRADRYEQLDQLANAGDAEATVTMLAERLADHYNLLSSRSLARAVDEDSKRREALAALGYLGAGAAGSSGRGIPARIRPADPAPDGTLGWEAP